MKWLVSVYSLPNDSNMNKFFEKMTTSLDMALKKYETCNIAGRFSY